MGVFNENAYAQHSFRFGALSLKGITGKVAFTKSRHAWKCVVHANLNFYLGSRLSFLGKMPPLQCESLTR